MKRIQIGLLFAVALALGLGAAPARATVIQLHGYLDGLQLVPPNASPGYGEISATLDDTSGLFTVTSGTYGGLLAGALQVLLSDAPAGSTGPLIMLLTLDTPGATSGTISGGGTITDAGQLADVLAEKGYVRVTSSIHPGGELRAQLLLVPEPGSLALCAVGLAGLAALRRRDV